MSKLMMKKLSFKLILLKILQLKYKTPSSHPTGFRSNLLSLLRVYGKKDGSHSHVVVSDYLLHAKYAVMTFLALLMNHVENNVKHFENYMFFSDDAASQFKQRFTLCEIKLLGKSLSWNFFATGHGKGVFNDIGGALKRIVHTAALAKNIVIKNIDDFFDVASETSTKINVL